MRKPSILIAATLVAAASVGAAVAQQQTATYDPSQLPSTQGKVAEYSLTPRGDVDGLILVDGTEVHLPPHLGTQLAFAVKPGDAVTIHGLKARALPMIQAMSVTNDATGATVTDTGPAGGPGRHGPQSTLSATGRIKGQLHGPDGEVNGVVLEDGTIVRMPPPEAQRLGATIAVGAPLTVRGVGMESPLGRVIEARSVGPDETKLADIASPRPRPPGNRPPPPPAPDAPPR